VPAVPVQPSGSSIETRIRDAERFAGESLVLLLKHQPTGVELDVSMAGTDFEHEALAASSVTMLVRRVPHGAS
jgi:hypothetical protein